MDIIDKLNESDMIALARRNKTELPQKNEKGKKPN
jgi:hypothetical protein